MKTGKTRLTSRGTPAAKKRVVVAFRLAGEPGRRKLAGFLRYIREHELPWQLQFVRIKEDFSAEFVASLEEQGIDGIVYSMPSAKDGARELSKLNIPTVAIDIYDDSILKGRRRNLIYILGDAEAIGRSAARNLLAQGIFRSYGFVADQQNSVWGRLRGDAFIDELKSNGFATSRYRSRGSGYDLPALTAWITGLQKPAGVFVAFDDRAFQVLEACRQAGAEIPADIAVIGVDNDEMLCTNSTPPLTSILPDNDQLGYLAAGKLSLMMDGQTSTDPEHIRIGVKSIIIRESTSPLSNSGRLVQKALAFIRANASKAIKPRDVAAHLKVSRSLADLRFRELQHETMGDAILRHRLEEVRQRLVSTNETIENIAIDCQFAKVSRLSKAFKAVFGLTMKEYRLSTRR